MITKIDGTYMDRSLKDFVEECEDRIEIEEAKMSPDTSLIALLADAVRLTRELTRVVALRDTLLALRPAPGRCQQS